MSKSKVTLIGALLIMGTFLLSCTGDQGPAGPAGPPGGTVVSVEGWISYDSYEGDQIAIYSVAIRERAVTQVYLAAPDSPHVWGVVDFVLADGVVFVYNPSRSFMGWRYLIMIIPPEGG